MARIRAIKPEFWSSPNLPADPWTRLLYIAMWNWADDMGVGTANPRELLGFAFPNDDDITPGEIRRMLGGIRRVFGVEFYEVAGRPYYAIPNWSKHQKFDNRAKGKYPGVDQAESRLYQDIPDDTAEPAVIPSQSRRDAVAGTGEQGNRGTGEIGTGEQSSSSEVADATGRPELDALLDLLDSEIVANGGKAPARTKKNVDAVRLMVDRDNHTPEQVAAAIRWAQGNEFWRSNVLSMSKLREKYDQLRLQAQREKPNQATPALTRTEQNMSVVQRLAAQEAEEARLEINA